MIYYHYHYHIYYLFISFFKFLRFSLNISYFSLSLNVGNFGTDVFLTQLIFGASEIPAHVLCVWLLEVVGRKVSLMSTLLVGGLTCILILAVPQGKAVQIFCVNFCSLTANGCFDCSVSALWRPW